MLRAMSGVLSMWPAAVSRARWRRTVEVLGFGPVPLCPGRMGSSRNPGNSPG